MHALRSQPAREVRAIRVFDRRPAEFLAAIEQLPPLFDDPTRRNLIDVEENARFRDIIEEMGDVAEEPQVGQDARAWAVAMFRVEDQEAFFQVDGEGINEMVTD